MGYWRKNWFTFLVWGLGIVFSGFSMWQSSQINSALLGQRITNIETALADGKLTENNLIPRFYQVETIQSQQVRSIEEIKATLNRLEDKVDRLLIK